MEAHQHRSLVVPARLSLCDHNHDNLRFKLHAMPSQMCIGGIYRHRDESYIVRRYRELKYISKRKIWPDV
jgi:hypothetical protein